jgi:hypothetical protein
MATNGTSQAPPVSMAMSPEEFAELRDQVAAIGLTDFHLGRVLEAMLLHLGHAHDLDPTVEDARLAALAQAEADAAAAKAEEDAKAAAAAATPVAPAQEGN